MCYLRAVQFGLDRPWTEEEIEDYKEAGPVMVQQGLERGDWRTIELLTKAAPGRPGSMVPMLHHAVRFDASNPYRMNRLLHLGAAGAEYARLLDVMAPHHAEGITAEQRASADRWAAQTYRQYFSYSPKLEKAPPDCVRALIGYDPNEH